ncbi:MAG TPA: ImmA/IrrE family metallo-endopeptidase [Thermodesulfobacteriota bacterium]|nr:ImmA/IrrE family metallo-endopeptidase [Thermodesulfobacteriota bacterium]
MPKRIPITPSVLKWARERSGFSIQEMTDRYKFYGEWESGDSYPTYNQLEQLSDKFKCPIVVFFFPEPPELEPIEKSFRTLPEIEFEYMPPMVRMQIRKAKAMQLNLIELHEGINPSRNFIIRDLDLDLKKSTNELASEVRDYLQIPLKEQVDWHNHYEAFDNWRNLLTTHGVYVFKDAFRANGYSGICLYHDQFPLIYVNNSTAITRQIFTLFHELAHLLFHTSGIDKENDNYIDILRNNERRIEIFCNEFAGKFLVPDTDFTESIIGLKINEQNISSLANKYKVSREVILRKYLDRNMVSSQLYREKVAVWMEENNKSKGEGGNYYYTQITYLGHPYIDLALTKYHQNRFDALQLSDYLNIQPKFLEKFEETYNSLTSNE